MLDQFKVQDLCREGFRLPGAPYVKMYNRILRVVSRGAFGGSGITALFSATDPKGSEVEQCVSASSQPLLFKVADFQRYLSGCAAMFTTSDLLESPSFDPRYTGSRPVYGNSPFSVYLRQEEMNAELVQIAAQRERLMNERRNQWRSAAAAWTRVMSERRYRGG